MGAFWFVIVVFVVAGYMIAFTRKGRVSSATLGARRKEIYIMGDIESVYARLATMQGKFSVDDKDPDKKIIVLSSPVSFATWGFLYPVFLHPANANGTRIELGIHSKFFQLGPLVTRSHDECEAAIRAALGVPEARVA
jgi:hypothetical protein